MKDAFVKTRIPNVSEAIKNTFPTLDAAVYADACKILEYELAHADNRGSAAIGKHLSQNILPGYACWKALINAGVEDTRAVDFVEAEMCAAVARMARSAKWLGTKKCAFPVFKFLFTLGFKTLYPKQGWTVKTIEDSDKRIRMDVTACVYCEELQKRGALALCRAFCETDHESYDPLAPGVIFKRDGTLAATGVKCDFCFERGEN